MKVWRTVFLVILGIAGVAWAADKPLATGRIVDVQRKANTRVLYYLVNTPVTQDDPYYEVSVQLGNTVYRGVHTPKHKGDALPEQWKPAADVQARVDGKVFYIKRPDGSEMEFTIAKRIVEKPGSGNAPPDEKK